MRTFRAPGRVNLIGEHTDHNGGLVMPVAIDRETRVTLAPTTGSTIKVESRNLAQSFEFDPTDPGPPCGDWTDYVRGVAAMLTERGAQLRGTDLLIESNVPLGAGLSSSASLEVAVAYALLANSGLSLAPEEIATSCQQAENNFVGVQCGIMDQYIACCARAGTALMLDCDSMQSCYLPWPSSVTLVICNTMVKHELAAGAYNDRRAECEAAAKIMGVKTLSELTPQDLAERGRELPETLYRRARHVVTENARVMAVATALENNDLGELGTAFAGSHASLRDDFQVSCAELDLMVELASQQGGVLGARMTGGGFGGCTINLVERDSVERFRGAVVPAYTAETGIVPDIYVCRAAAGAGEVTSCIK